MPRKGEKAFTLIELLIVIAIIGILAAIAIPQFGKYRADAARTATAATIKQCVTSMVVAHAAGEDTAALTALGIVHAAPAAWAKACTVDATVTPAVTFPASFNSVTGTIIATSAALTVRAVPMTCSVTAAGVVRCVAP